MNRITAIIIFTIFAIFCAIYLLKNPLKFAKAPSCPPPTAAYFSSEKLDTGVTNMIKRINFKDRLAAGTYKRESPQGYLLADDSLTFVYQALEKTEPAEHVTIHANDLDNPTACGIDKIEIDQEKHIKLFFNPLFVSPDKKRLVDVEAATITMLRKIAEAAGKEVDQVESNRKTWQ